MNTLEIRQAPAVDGVAFRPFRGGQDYAPMTALHNIAHQAYGDEEVLSVGEMAHYFENIGPDLDLSRDMLVAEAGGELAGYAIVEHSLRSDGEQRVLSGYRRSSGLAGPAGAGAAAFC